jgi:excisionase family DNA binding protein
METYWNVDDVAAALKVSVQTVYRYVMNDDIPFHKLNRAVRFKPSEIESWLESKRAGLVLVNKTPVVNDEKHDAVLFTDNAGS